MRLVLLTVLLGIAFAAQRPYEKYKVLRITPTPNQQEMLSQFRDQKGFDFWNEPRGLGANVDIMVAPAQYPAFVKFLKDKKIAYSILHENFQKVLDDEVRYQRTAPKTRQAISFNKYHRHSQINQYLDELATKYPNLVSLKTIGKSYEGREMKLIKISSGGSRNQPAIFIDAGIHAREWIAPAMALYIINQLVENNAANSNITEGLAWYILPVLNPDGYEYSHTHDRMWRKTRSKTSNFNCAGVDGNRNFNFHWMETGASKNPCLETYGGAAAFSEKETQALRDFALSKKNELKLYLSFHSYGNFLLYPWGYTSSLPSDWKQLHSLAEQANKAHVAAGGASYRIGSSTNVLYAAAGGSDDYMKGANGIQLSYTVELTSSIYGFDFPPSQIQETVSRFFNAIRVFAIHVKTNF